MSVYRSAVFGVILFAVVYPVVSGGMLLAYRHESISEIYPIASWALFCFVPIQERDYAIRLETLDGHPLEAPRYLEESAELSEKQKLIASNVVREMASLHENQDSQGFRARQSFLEQSFLQHVAESARYTLVRREFDVLKCWKTGRYETIEPLVECAYGDDTEEL